MHYLIIRKISAPRDLNELFNRGIINRRIYNLLNSRLIDFYSWLENNKKVLYDRINLLKSYLKHELSSLLYYVEFAKPYLDLQENYYKILINL